MLSRFSPRLRRRLRCRLKDVRPVSEDGQLVVMGRCGGVRVDTYWGYIDSDGGEKRSQLEKVM
jgi:hypothetical protein